MMQTQMQRSVCGVGNGCGVPLAQPCFHAARGARKHTHGCRAAFPALQLGDARTAPAAAAAAASRHTAAVTHPRRGRSSAGTPAAAAAPGAAAAAAAVQAPTQDEQLRAAAISLARAADETKAGDIVLLHVEPLVSWTSYMLICTVMSRPQLLAVLGRMEDAAAAHGLSKQNTAGSSQWEVLDFGSIVCQVFTADQREHYGLDDFYSLAEEVELPFAQAPSGAAQQQPGAAAAAAFDGPGPGSGAWSKSL